MRRLPILAAAAAALFLAHPAHAVAPNFPEGVLTSSATVCAGGVPVSVISNPIIHTTCPELDYTVQASADGLECPLQPAFPLAGTLELIHFCSVNASNDCTGTPNSSDSGPLLNDAVDNCHAHGGSCCGGSDPPELHCSPPNSGFGCFKGKAVCSGSDEWDFQMDATKFSIANRSFTVEFWAKGTAKQNKVFKYCPDGTKDWQCMSFSFTPTSASNSLTVTSWTVHGENDLHYAPTTGQPDPADGNWHYLAFVFDATSLNRFLYVDGKNFAAQSSTKAFQGTGDTMYVDGDGGSNQADYDISDFRLQQAAMSADQVEARFFASHQQFITGGSLQTITGIPGCTPNGVTKKGTSPSVLSVQAAAQYANPTTPIFSVSGNNSLVVSALSTHDLRTGVNLTWAVDPIGLEVPTTPIITAETKSSLTFDWSPLQTGTTYICDIPDHSAGGKNWNTRYIPFIDGGPQTKQAAKSYAFSCSNCCNTTHLFHIEAVYHDDCDPGDVGPSGDTPDLTAVTLAGDPTAPTMAAADIKNGTSIVVHYGNNDCDATHNNPVQTRYALLGSNQGPGTSPFPTYFLLNQFNRRDNTNLPVPFNVADQRTAISLPTSSMFFFRTIAENDLGALTNLSPATTNRFVTSPSVPLNLQGVPDTDPGHCPKEEIKWSWSDVQQGSSCSPVAGPTCAYTNTGTEYRMFAEDGVTDTSGGLGPGGQNFFHEGSLTPSQTITREVQAFDGNAGVNGNQGAHPEIRFGSLTSSSTATTAPRQIPATTGVAGTPQSPTSILWSWNPPPFLCPRAAAPTTYGFHLFDAQTATFLADVNGSPPANTFTQTAFPTGGPALGINTLHSLVIQAWDKFQGKPATLGTPSIPDPTNTFGGDLSLPTSAYTQANPPTTLAESGVSTGSLVLNWSGSGNPGYTRYEVAEDAVDNFVTTAVSTPIPLGANLTSNSAAILNLQPATTYFFNVRAFNGRAQDPYGDVPTTPLNDGFQTLTLTPILTPILPIPADTTHITFTWNSITGTSGYNFSVIGGGTTFFPPGATTTPALAVGGPNQQLGATIISINAQGLGNASPPVYAFSNATPPAAAANGITAVSSVSVSYAWLPNGNPGYTFYEVQVATDSTFINVVATVAFQQNSGTVGGLFPGTTYYAQVRALSGSQVPTGYLPLTYLASISTTTNRDPLVAQSTSPLSAYSNPGDLVALFHFDDSSGTVISDSSPFHNNGTISCGDVGFSICTSTPLFVAGPPNLNAALSFSGQVNNALVAFDPGIYDFSDSVTVEAWVNPASASMPDGAGIVTKGFGGQENFALRYFGGRYSFIVRDPALNPVVATATMTVRVGLWDHVIGVYDSGTGRASIYVNGILSATSVTTAASRLNFNFFPIIIGNFFDTASFQADLGFNGAIDEVRIIHRAFTPVQALTDYQSYFPSQLSFNLPSNVCLQLPPNAFGAPAEIYASPDPINHPLRISFLSLTGGLANQPTGQILIPGSLIEIVPTVNGVPYTAPLGSSATLCIAYTDANRDGIIDGTKPPIAASSLHMYTLDTSVGRWVGLPSTLDAGTQHIFATTPHFSVFGLFGASSVGSALSQVRVYPIPWKIGANDRFDAAGLTFDNLPLQGTIRVFTLAGTEVVELPFNSGGAGKLVWDGRNRNGKPVASGVYFAFVKSGTDNNTTVIKFAIER